MTRLFCDFPLAVGKSLDLPKDMIRHIMVLRLSKGDSITLFNGQGGEYKAVILEMGRNRTVAVIVSFIPREVELPYQITLAQGLPEAAKMDWIIEKAVELGVHRIVPLAAKRSVVRLNADRAEKRLARWQAIAISASEQCGRNRLADIACPLDFSDYIQNSPEFSRIMLSPHAKDSLASWASVQEPQALSLLIGSEGGFSPDEEELALQNNVILLSMGPRVLRTETAGMAAISAINAIWEKHKTPL